jgi:hypothetical protein
VRGEGGLACEAFETVSVIKGYTNNIDVKFIKGYLAIMFNNTDLFFAFCKVSFNKSQDANGHWFTSGILF